MYKFFLQRIFCMVYFWIIVGDFAAHRICGRVCVLGIGEFLCNFAKISIISEVACHLPIIGKKTGKHRKR